MKQDATAGTAGLPARIHGTSGPLVIALHGGPAAAGSAGPLARGLADSFRVLEPRQRGSGDEPLTVARHIADLHELVETRCHGERPALVGESWGAMLALACAAAHPESTGPLVLVGCGTFDKAAREKTQQARAARVSEDLRCRLAQLQEMCLDSAERFKRWRELTCTLDDYDPITTDPEPQDLVEPFDYRAHAETWNDMLRLQEEGVYPAAFKAIESPVLMLHGDHDPHPGPMIRQSLDPHLRQLEYHELSRCGHCPWNEKYARDDFFAVLHEWLSRHHSARNP